MGEVPEVGQVEQLEDGIRRIIAPNASPMTYWGTNTYLLGEGAMAVIDPGSDDPDFLERIYEAANKEISHIFVTHSHYDHTMGARALSEMSGAPIYGFGAADRGQSALMKRLVAEGLTSGGEGVDHAFSPDIQVDDGDIVQGDNWALQVVWTPGHISNHICLAYEDALFSGDHVMEWATSIVSPPDGEIGAFLSSCQRLIDRKDQVFLPGHGAPVFDPVSRTQWLIDHRKEREGQILAVIGEGALTPRQVVEVIYKDIPKALYPAAERNVFAHLIDLCERGLVNSEGEIRSDATYFGNA